MVYESDMLTYEYYCVFFTFFVVLMGVLKAR